MRALTAATVDRMSMVTDGTFRDQRIDACDTDLSGTWKTPEGHCVEAVEEEYDQCDHVNLERQHRVDESWLDVMLMWL